MNYIKNIRESLSYNNCNIHLSCEPHKIIGPTIYVVHMKNVCYNYCNLVFDKTFFLYNFSII